MHTATFGENDIQSAHATVNALIPQNFYTVAAHSSYKHPYVKLPTIKLEPFGGDIEEWQRFWEQFVSSIDSNSELSQIDKHVFLRGYLEGEPK